MKKPKTHRVPRTRAGKTMTEAQFWGFIRAGLRSKSQRWPPRYHILNKHKRNAVGKRHRYEYQCADCKEWFKQADVQVDHIVPCGSLKSFDDVGEFTKKLFCEEDGLRVLCKSCHQLRTNEERDAKNTAR